MSIAAPLQPTEQQVRIIEHEGSAFIEACPGAGKTRVLVERARLLLRRAGSQGAVAFLSFTTAAVSELERRLREEGLLGNPVYPHFIGTFDSFVWQFLIAPFGIPGCDRPPRVIPDLESRQVTPPWKNAKSLPLSCFHRETGELLPDEARRHGYVPLKPRAYETIAMRMRERHRQDGQLDFEDSRALAAERIADHTIRDRLGGALAARFSEVVVDEAQDCNPADLDVIRWLHRAGIATKIIGDPHQAIYGFRGGVTDHLDRLKEDFDCRPLTGNFRSSRHICQAIVALRRLESRDRPDEALGREREVDIPVHLVAYGGGVSRAIGERFRDLLTAHHLSPSECRILAATRDTASKAVGGIPLNRGTEHRTLRLADAINGFFVSFDHGNRIEALRKVHHVLLDIECPDDGFTYYQRLERDNLEEGDWRAEVLDVIRALRYDATIFSSAKDWLNHAHRVLEGRLHGSGPSIRQRLRWTDALPAIIEFSAPIAVPCGTIHSAKGLEFPAVCVVLPSPTVQSIIGYLETGQAEKEIIKEEARKVYVAASRARRLLVLATPKAVADRIADHIRATGASVKLVKA